MVLSEFWDHIIPGSIITLFAVLLIVWPLFGFKKSFSSKDGSNYDYSETRTFFITMTFLTALAAFGGVLIDSVVLVVRNENAFVTNRMHLAMFWAFIASCAAFFVDTWAARSRVGVIALCRVSGGPPQTGSFSKTREYVPVWRIGGAVSNFLLSAIFYGHSAIEMPDMDDMDNMTMTTEHPARDVTHFIFSVLFASTGFFLILSHLTRSRIWDAIAMLLFLDAGIWMIVVACIIGIAEYDPTNPNYSAMDAFPDATIMVACTSLLVIPICAIADRWLP